MKKTLPLLIDRLANVGSLAADTEEERLRKAVLTFMAIRIGVNTGPVVAGVIGRKKFIYDLWGDAVNTASRMESHGVGGGIQVTEATYERLKDKYRFESRGTIHVKGKGELTAYLLTGRK